ncbi:MAG: hypothetical protein IKO55_08400 [Kiritimatiellae bacterium]|nr:hypothetical protein [Kiritimatiellia bacterium]
MPKGLCTEYSPLPLRGIPPLGGGQTIGVSSGSENSARPPPRLTEYGTDSLVSINLAFRNVFPENNLAFKPLFLDVGLASRSLGLKLVDYLEDGDALLQNQGGVCEQFIGQHILLAFPSALHGLPVSAACP